MDIGEQERVIIVEPLRPTIPAEPVPEPAPQGNGSARPSRSGS
jgi:hypothetical protein